MTIKNILFDFDGVILDSMPVRDFGFKEIFKSFEKKSVDSLIQYHHLNGGLSRYVKIKYFYDDILGENIDDNQINFLANEFSKIMRKELINKKYLIDETMVFIKNSYKKYNLHIVSGSDENELVYLCEKLGIDRYFHSINGSPVNKNMLTRSVIHKFECRLNETIFIGDSINDYDAAKTNGLEFYGFNNKALKNISKQYIVSFKKIFV